jgi:tetratricopeptide (TPR) repeat protein/TolB-like protein
MTCPLARWQALVLVYPCTQPPRDPSLTDSPGRLARALAERYRVERELGRGGMAVVYAAHDLRHDRPVAIKVLRPELSASLGADRFLREIRVAARLQHPHILAVLDSGEIPPEAGIGAATLWYAMPLVPGESLRDRLRREGAQPIGDVLRWTAELADALAYAHAQGIVHRDIKPENVLLSTAGRDPGMPPHALLADFGVARALETGSGERLTETGLALGTPAYMSPEQSLGDATLDGRSDLYSLGCVLYELLTGEPPYTGPTAQAIVAKRLSDPIPSARRLRESVPPALDLVLERLLAKAPADRYGSAAQLSAALATLPPSGAASPVTGATPARRPARPLLIGAGAVLIAGLVGVGLARRSGSGRAALDPATVAVIPFRVTAPDQSLDYLGEGIVDLLAVKLDGSAGVRTVPPRQLLAALRYQPGHSVTAEDAEAAARRTGAGRLLDGSLFRSGGGIELSATLRRTDGAGRPVQAEASGSLDSLPVLVDRLAAGLLAGQAGSTPSLGELSSARALTAYLRGKAADRQGRYADAVAAFGDALTEDSTFALAALDQIGPAQRTNDAEAIDRASRLAWTYRARLSAKGRVLLRALVGPRYPEPSSQISLIAAWQDAVQAVPELPDAWFLLGDIQLHNGGLNDVPRPVENAIGSFQRALELDPAWSLPLDHILLAKLYLDDTAGFRPLARRWLAQDTAGADRSPYLRWRLGVALGDSGLVARERAGLERWSDDAVHWLAGEAQAEGVGLADVALAIGELRRRAVSGRRLWEARRYRRGLLLNSGRPTEALALTDSMAWSAPWPDWAPITRIEDALFWDGDTAAASADVRVLAAKLERRQAGPRLGSDIRSLAACRLGLWSLARADSAGVRRWVGALREGTPAGPAFNGDDRTMCAGLLDAGLDARGRRADARLLLDQADSLFIASDILIDYPIANLVMAQLRQAIGDLPGAARAIGRVPVALPVPPVYGSTYLLEQARIGLEVGDTAGAVRALRRYVALRAGAEPALRPAADSARALLARLVGR